MVRRQTDGLREHVSLANWYWRRMCCPSNFRGQSIGPNLRCSYSSNNCSTVRMDADTHDNAHSLLTVMPGFFATLIRAHLKQRERNGGLSSQPLFFDANDGERQSLIVWCCSKWKKANIFLWQSFNLSNFSLDQHSPPTHVPSCGNSRQLRS